MENDIANALVGATFIDETITLASFRSYVSATVGRKKARPSLVLAAPYYTVEYLNSPVGLIVLAHHDTVAGQVDGIHPATIGKSIVSAWNIIEPLKGKLPDTLAYNVHYMTRRSQGSLVLEAYGRMIHGGDGEARSFSTEKSFRLEFYNTKIGPIIGAIESSERVCVIRPKHVQDEKLGYEVAA